MNRPKRWNHLPLTILAASLTCALVFTACASNRPAGEQFSDAAITAKIESKLVADTQVAASNVDVDTLDGVVTLRGEVEKEEARVEAEQLAAATKGVESVRNELEVVSPQEEDDSVASDAWIVTRINAKYTADPQLNPFNIDVDAHDGVVTLSGVVSDESSREEALELAMKTKGVKKVRNELKLDDSSDDR